MYIYICIYLGIIFEGWYHWWGGGRRGNIKKMNYSKRASL